LTRNYITGQTIGTLISASNFGADTELFLSSIVQTRTSTLCQLSSSAEAATKAHNRTGTHLEEATLPVGPAILVTVITAFFIILFIPAVPVTDVEAREMLGRKGVGLTSLACGGGWLSIVVLLFSAVDVAGFRGGGAKTAQGVTDYCSFCLRPRAGG
jgi:hypothetical protein